jgi:hypothetical protein
MRYMILAALAATLGTAASAHATQFVVNGDFTAGAAGAEFDSTGTAVPGWMSTGYNWVFSNANTPNDNSFTLWTSANGGANSWDGSTLSGAGNFAALDGDFITAPITQTITGLTVGQTYTLSFDYAFSQQFGFDGDTIQNITVGLGSFTDTLPSPAGTTLPNHGFSGWTPFSTTIKATDSTEVLSFLAFGNLPVPPFALVSDVSLTGGTGAVPEASTWAMMLIGFGGVAFAAFRSRRRVAATA